MSSVWADNAETFAHRADAWAAAERNRSRETAIALLVADQPAAALAEVVASVNRQLRVLGLGTGQITLGQVAS